tara:strand:+ start:14136 stop:14945 length:810 start_codon:yes stop_codon:yes gene_type:complete
MLINTIILFFRDALPIFVITTILISLLHQQGIKQRWYVIAAFASVLLSLLLLTTIDDISRTLDDTGREWLYAFCYIVCYFLSLILLGQLVVVNTQTRRQRCFRNRAVAMALMAILMTLNGANFLIYLTGFWYQNNASNVLTTGVVLGVGICASIAVLLYFFMAFFQRYCRIVREILLIFFSAGLLMKASNLLIQIDVLPSDNFLWDSNHVIAENAEVGQLLTAFFGYDATPTMLQLWLYLSAIMLAFFVLFRANPTKLNQRKTVSKEAV